MEISGKIDYPSLKGTHLKEGICLNRKIEQGHHGHHGQKPPRYDILELKETGENQKPLCTQEIKVEGPPEFRKISKETLESFNNMIHNSIELASKKHITGGERISFLENSVKSWVKDKKENDEEMFAMYLKISKSDIQEGANQLVGLPADFTMEDYHYYVDKWENIWEAQRTAWNDFFHKNK